MSRLLPLLLIAIMIFSGCSESGVDSTRSPDDSGEIGVDLLATPTPPVATTSPRTPTAFPTDLANPTQDVDAGGEATPIDTPVPDPTATPGTENGPNTPLPTTSESVPIVFPTFPPVPEVTSCAHAADLSIEQIQVWLDAMALLPEEAIWNEDPMSEEFDQFAEQMDAQMKEIEDQASALGCSYAELETLIFERFDQLVANNPNAVLILEMLRDMVTEEGFEPEPTETVEPTQEPVEVTIESCDEAADIFVERMQVLVLDAIAGMTVEELDAMADPPESVLQFVEEMVQLQKEFQAIGCSDRDVTQLIGERLDQLTVDGPAAQEIFESLQDAIADGNIFDDLG